MWSKVTWSFLTNGLTCKRVKTCRQMCCKHTKRCGCRRGRHAAKQVMLLCTKLYHKGCTMFIRAKPSC
ncbi:unnamed protein product [Callosobruchus maculatus]|uniref:Uncharacterized protein n=1 Tax=Callosobruchus maculatus TaxID=64391 RepID=A0A653DNW9_CALMS|nr:unnamed protein product [Callosobruchus maculatus]VEN61914.1 unnamed protein product [Callosobruchus maculatus]